LKVVIGRSAFSLAAGQSASLSATLNGFGIRRLKVAKGHRLPVTIVANATAGNSVTRRATLTETVRTHRKKR
jgi:hypothetical protein